MSWENSDYYCREKPADRRRRRLVDRREDLIPIGTPPETVTRFFTFQHRLKPTHIMYLNDEDRLLVGFLFPLARWLRRAAKISLGNVFFSVTMVVP